MNTDNQQTEDAELSAVMAPYMALPVATPQMLLALGQHLSRKQAEAETKREESQPASGAAWMNVTQLAAHFGIHRTTMHRALAHCLETGKVRCIRPAGENRRYNLADVTAVMMQETNPHGKATA